MKDEHKSLISGPIDQYGRYRIVADTIKSLVPNTPQGRIKILDVGGYKGLTSRFFSESRYEVTVVDLYESSSKNYVQGSALDLPFDDGSFDFVVTFEVLEHIPRADRERFFSELVRVSKGTILLTAPFAGPHNEVAETEVLVNDVWRTMYKKDHLWLGEHIDNRIPTEKEIEALITKRKLPFRKIGNNDILHWNLLVSFNFLTTLFRASGSNPDVQRFYNENMHTLNAAAEVYYRYIYVIGEGASVKLPSGRSVSSAEKIKTEAMLVNKVFTTIAKDVQKLISAKDKQLQTVAKELEKRIQLHDELAKEVQLLTTNLARRNNTLPARIKRKVSRKGAS